MLALGAIIIEIMVRLLLGIFFLASLSCSSRKGEVTSFKDNKMPALNNEINSDTCSFCSLDQLSIKPSSTPYKTAFVIDYPVAIEFFVRASLARKYDNEDGYDSLMKLFDLKGPGDRTKIYNLLDQYGYYTQGLKPELLKYSVATIDTVKATGFITLKDQDISYLIDLSAYEQTDGVVMFTPGKRPIFWTMNRDQEYCFGLFGVSKWYYNCP